MTRLTEDMLDMTLSRLGGGLPIRREHVDLGDVVTSSIEDLGAEHASRLLVDVQGDATGSWDRARLGQVLSNLFSNALKYGAASEPIRVRIDGTGPSVVVIEVHNGGEPIAEALLPIVFDPFRRGVGEMHRRGEGVGLGLFIAEQIVRSHGGTIEVRSSREHGTTFSITLPRGDGA
jgi:signal transduction histidine kinase